jgi:hypothetical protein
LTGGKAYTVWYDLSKNCFFIKASAEGNTVAYHVLAGDTFSNDNDTGLIGTMVNNGAVIITPSTVNQVILKDYHNGNGYVVGDSDLVSANIKAGANIFNVQGKASVVDTEDANATTAQILAGFFAYVKGSKVNGNASIQSLGGYKMLFGKANVIANSAGGVAFMKITTEVLIIYLMLILLALILLRNSVCFGAINIQTLVTVL